jgi:hypothetical protein
MSSLCKCITVNLVDANNLIEDTNEVEPTFGGQYTKIIFLFFSIDKSSFNFNALFASANILINNIFY